MEISAKSGHNIQLVSVIHKIILYTIFYAEGGATEVYCSQAICLSVASISHCSLKNK